MKSVADLAAPRVTDRTPDGLLDIAYVGGAGRSGSTVLALLMAQMPGFVAAGGVSNLWERGLQQNYLCGCGAHFRDCAFWYQVGNVAFGGWEQVDGDELAAMKLQLTRYRHWPWHLAPHVRPAFASRLAGYSEYVGRVYAAIRTVSGSKVVVDTSHDPMSALVLRHMPHVNLRIIHLVRDSRAVAFSLSRRVRRPEATVTETYMPRYSALPASTGWLVANIPYHTAPLRSVPRLRVRYESLVALPGSEVARIARFLGSGLGPTDVAHFDASSIEIADNHMISGNPHRLGRRSVRVRIDDEWRSSMRPLDRMVVSAITLPLRAAYGYTGNRDRGESDARLGLITPDRV
jgi:hypothetical protein